jgi:ribose 5-phosphate isomerase B
MIYIGSDHAGYGMKKEIVNFLKGRGKDTVDLGAFSEDSVDYPDIAREVAEKVSENPGSQGVLICGTGTGMVMVANKLDGVRAAVATNETMAEMARRHNDANVITLGARLMNIELAKKLVGIFLDTPFDAEERHKRRVAKIAEIEKERDAKKKK